MLIGNGTHDAAHGQAVEVVINEDQTAQQDRGQLCAHPGLDMSLGPTAEGGGAAGLVHQGNHGTQNDQEHDNAHVPRVGDGGHDAVVEHVQHSIFEIKIGIHQAAGQNADEQGGVDFLGDQGQYDGDDRGQQGPCSVVEHADSFCLIAGSESGGDQSQQHHQSECHAAKPVEFKFHFFSLLLNKAHCAQGQQK